jgi:hypothetical protein
MSLWLVANSQRRQPVRVAVVVVVVVVRRGGRELRSFGFLGLDAGN